MAYEIVIGLEIHAELSTKSKIYCGCSTKFGGAPNTNCCPICIGMPGVLPVLNKKVVEFAIKAGLAMNCTISRFSKQDRKNYFYPDLPKAYQISQFDQPLCKNGFVEINSGGIKKKIGITRIHIEEDAGKLMHDECEAVTLADYNRCGVPLIEIVSEPDMRSPEEARAFVESVKAILEYLDICDCKMQEGSLRADVNLSVKPVGADILGTRTEMKNLNSFRLIQRAAENEAQRQIREIEAGRKIIQETRRWDDAKGHSYTMRSKEEAHDYRYFTDPDLAPIVIDDLWLERITASLPELPAARKSRYVNDFGLPEYDAGLLVSSKRLADFFEDAVKESDNIKAVSNWIMGEMMRLLKEKELDVNAVPFPGSYIAKLVSLIDEGTISGTIARKVFGRMFETGKEPSLIVKEEGLEVVSDEGALCNTVRKILDANPQSVADFKNGKEKVFGFLMGQAMKEMSGKADPQAISRLLKKELG